MKNPKLRVISRWLAAVYGLAIIPGAIADNPVYTDVALGVGISHEVDFPRIPGPFWPFGPVIQGFGAGAAWVDIDNDGDDDAVFSNPQALPVGESQSWIYRNNGNGTFTDITATAFGATGGFGNGKHSMGVVAADYDGDGFDDVLLLNGSNTSEDEASDRNQLYRNNGDGTFSDVTSQAGVDEPGSPRWSFSGAFGDVDGDGDLDLYIGNYVGINGSANCAGNYFYRNNGDGTFTRQAAALGIANAGCNLATTFTDVDKDGDLDLWVINDFGQSFGANELYRNDGLDVNGDPIFTASAAAMNLNVAIFGMGIAVGDLTNNGASDYYITNLGANVLHKNNGDGTFSDIAPTAGVDDEFIDGSTIMSTSWGTAFFDADNDGLQDLYVANGWIGNMSGGFLSPNPNRLYMNNGNETLTDVAPLLGADVLSDTSDRGLAVADYDNDGDVDMLVLSPGDAIYDSVNFITTNVPRRPKLLRNDTANGANWLRVNLKGNNPNHRGIGARVRVITSSNAGVIRTQYREVSAGSSHVSSNGLRPLFGLGDHESVVLVAVTWPSGCVSRFNTVAVNTEYTVNEWTCGLPNGVAGSINVDTGGVLEGALVKAVDPWNGTVYGTDISDAEGHYSIARDVCICNMFATKIGWDISWDNLGPGGQVWAWINNNLVMGDFTATRVSGTLSGYAIGADGNPVGNVSISGSNSDGSNSFTTQTDGSGYYEAEVPDDTYWVQGGPGGGCSSFWPEGNHFLEWLVTVNFDDRQKNVICQP